MLTVSCKVLSNLLWSLARPLLDGNDDDDFRAHLWSTNNFSMLEILVEGPWWLMFL